MKILESKYVGSFPNLETCPKAGRPEYAFIGRSNVGKSSLLNMLCGDKGLAHVSKKPGKTQMINYFSVNESWYLVDLPGYGYAKRSKSTKAAFGRMIEEYLSQRPTLFCAFVLVDVNVPPQKKDIAFINWLGEEQIPFVIVFTKSDRLSKGKLVANMEATTSAFSESWNQLPQQFITSAVSNTGRKELLDFIESVNKTIGS